MISKYLYSKYPFIVMLFTFLWLIKYHKKKPINLLLSIYLLLFKNSMHLLILELIFG